MTAPVELVRAFYSAVARGDVAGVVEHDMVAVTVQLENIVAATKRDRRATLIAGDGNTQRRSACHRVVVAEQGERIQRATNHHIRTTHRLSD